MKFMVRFECVLCGKTEDMFTEVCIIAHSDTDSLGNTSYDYSIDPYDIPDDWKRQNKCGSCP